MSDRPIVANLDFNDVKNDIISHFKSKEEFTDYEFTGSSLNLLMDILSYNTHYYSLASNFLLNESFLDTALLRQNVVSLAKRLNYVPRSISSASAVITVQFTKQNEDDSYVLIPAGSTFVSSSGNQTITFYTTQDYVLQFGNADAVGTKKTVDIVIKEGKYTTQQFVSSENYTDFAKFNLSQNNIDTTTLQVSVNGVSYQKVLPEDETILKIGSASAVYFIEESRSGSPILIFGNGIAGKALGYQDRIIATYLLSSGEAGNGIKTFSPSVPGRPDALITNVPSPSSGGGQRETSQSIRDNAPKWFQAQYRAVTTNDYEVILRNKYADIQAISVYGGEDVGFPGKVFICIKPKTGDKLTNAVKEILKQDIIKSNNIVTVRPDFVDPRIFKLELNTVVVYDTSKLLGTKQILQTKVKSLFEYSNTNYIGDFLSSFRESNLSREIKDLDPSIISSNTRVTLSSDVVAKNRFLEKYVYEFNNKVYHPVDGFLADKGGVFSSTLFKRVGRNFLSGFDEDGYGNIRLYDYIGDTKVYVNRKAGRLNYNTGKVEFLYDFDPVDTTFSISIIPESVDILASQDMILQIDTAKSTVDAIDVKETGILQNINLNRSF